MRYNKQTCHRCGAETNSLRASWFNIHLLCCDCRQEEAAHPLYTYAQHVEFVKTQTGNYFFAGIGLPVDIQTKHCRQ
ncbi:hypothetical protein [Adhaeribacter radiodurans]|uniref:Uncharacterized protein n=1 Tax=Adhaeribacter radiodurans TaxID=2745197 RepID=A0A7L7L8Z7_9BACT|nr:hypothetical protein [Adhaeribacter radiodurans]QMU29288.1 hypothetical protein HUW48_15150 [Adhaeribacter radiodurans]